MILLVFVGIQLLLSFQFCNELRAVTMTSVRSNTPNHYTAYQVSRLLENVNDLLSSLVDAPPSFCSYKIIFASKYVSPL